MSRIQQIPRLAAALMAITGYLLSAQQDTPPPTPSSPSASTTPAIKPAGALEEGFPVTNSLTVAKCAGCHTRDAKGNMTRISWIRTTPEGWEEAIKRMVRLNGLQLEPSEARQILRYLADEHGLAPEEAKPVAYVVEHRMVDEKIPNEDVARSCKACHALGRPLSWRRSADDWKLLQNMHVAFFPNVDSTAFLRPPRAPDAPPPAPGTDLRQPVEQALDYFVKNGPLHSPEWATWQSSQRMPKLTGRWLISGSQPGKGRVFGEMVIEPGAAADTFSTRTRLVYARDGSTLTSSGTGLVYTGYAWRGRSKLAAKGASVDAPESMREVMMVARDQSQMEGRWFWGAYQEFGLDVTLRRAGDGTAVQGIDISSLKSGSNGIEARVFGVLPDTLTTADFDFGTGVTVKQVVKREPGVVTVSLDVAPDAKPGRRDVIVKNAVLPGVLAVYDHVDYIKIPTDTALAHLGGDVHSKGYWQFEAIAYHNGPDGKPHTADDIELGPVPAQWKIEEFVATFGDDDTEFVGKLDRDTGLFIPAVDGPNPKRRQSRNNYGDVWAVATYTPPGAKAPLTAKGYLVVSVPQYVQWDQQTGGGGQ